MSAALELDVRLPLDRFELAVTESLPASAALLGPSGAGKSSLLESVVGLRPARGRIVAGGTVLLDTRRHVRLPPERRRIGWVPQDGALFPHLSVRSNLCFGRRVGDGPSLDEVVSSLDLEPLLPRHPRHLSGGERRRVALGRALLSAPRLLLLDEPTTGLDPRRARQALARVIAVRERFAVPLLVVTHRPEEAIALADHVVVIEEGRVTASGPAREVVRSVEAVGGLGADHVENVVRGLVVGLDEAGGVAHVRLQEGPTVSVPWQDDLAPDAAVVLAVDAEDVLLACVEPRELSARNVVAATVDEILPAGTSVLVRAGQWHARLTPAAVRDLRLAPGRAVWLVVKTHGWRVVAG